MSVEHKDNIQKIPWPFLQPPGLTAFGKIYLRNKLWEDYKTGNPSAETQAVIAHEREHIERLGVNLGTYIKFWTNRQFRFDEEVASITKEMAVLKKNGKLFNIEVRARDLSSFAYLWCTRYDSARNRLQDIWEEI